ncbi:hypothetical protein DXA21_21185, partial [Parabacteroides distasonis]
MLHLFEREGSNIKGLARIYLDDCFVINNVSVLQGKDNVFVAMPSYKTKQKDEQGKVGYQDVSVLQGKDNVFVAMPSYKTKQKDEQGKVGYQDVC